MPEPGLYDVYTPERLVARAMAHRPDFTPGKGWGYSSTGYILVDMIIERVTGRHWYDEVERRIVRPLGLTQTSWAGHSPAMPRPHARAYQPFGAGAPVDVTEQVIPDTGSAVVSTTRDVNAFFRALLGGRLLRPPQLAEMTRTRPVSPDLAEVFPGARYGLGIFERPLPCGGTYWSHPGGWSGYITDNGVTAGGRRSVVLSVNSVLAPDGFRRQQQAADALVEGALCGSGGARVGQDANAVAAPASAATALERRGVTRVELSMFVTPGPTFDVVELGEQTMTLLDRLQGSAAAGGVESVRHGGVPAGVAPAEAFAIGSLRVTLASAALPAVVGLVEQWLADRPVPSVRIIAEGDLVEVVARPSRRQRRRVDEFLRRHGA